MSIRVYNRLQGLGFLIGVRVCTRVEGFLGVIWCYHRLQVQGFGLRVLRVHSV